MIAVYAFRFVSDIEPVDERGILRGHTGRTVVRVAAQRLDTAQCQHHATGGGTQIGTECECPDDMKPGQDPAAGDNPDTVPQRHAPQRTVHEQPGVARRHTQRIGELQGCCTGAAVGAVDGDEVGRGLETPAVNLLEQVVTNSIDVGQEIELKLKVKDGLISVWLNMLLQAPITK